MSSPIIADGAVRIEGGRIIDVGRWADVDRSGARVDDLGEVVLLPGLINAHTHLELSHTPLGPPPASFGEWLLGVVSRRSTTAAEDVATAARDGAAECLRFGVTTVGDISRECAITRAALRDGPLRVVSFGEVQAMAQRRALLEERLAMAVDASLASETLSIGVSPHAPYTVEPDAYRRCVAVARERRLPICTHLAESPEESAFLNEHAGPLRELWRALGTWDDAVPRWAGSPVALAEATGLLSVWPVLAHVNYVDDAEIELLAARGASVVWCPRTHEYFGHPPHRWREMRARGVNVCVGTDSRASTPDLNVVDDLRLIHRQSPAVDASTLWAMVTVAAARALKRGDVGAIELGRRADFCAFAAIGDNPLAAIIETSTTPIGVWVGGKTL